MTPLDWFILVAPLTLVFAMAIYSRRYLRSVADFMSAGRVAGPYLLAVARGEMQAGAVVFVASFELISRSGFTLNWWGLIGIPVSLLVALSGFVVYRFRQTRALTLSQFFEQRYSRRLRVFTGMLGFVAGMVNFGIIPAVGARAMVYFLGLPATIQVAGWSFDTYIALMALFLGGALFMVLCGGLISMMVTDCLEGILSQVFYLVIIAALLMLFQWREINEVLVAQPPGQSLLNPFDSSGIKDFNLWYILMGLFVTVYGTMAWQNAQGYNSAAISPHASVMGGILGRWREAGKAAVVTLLAVCAMTFLKHPDFAAQAQPVLDEVARIGNPQIEQQMLIPCALSHFLPAGILGLLCAILLMGIIGGDSSHIHSWGGIFIQDVVMPLRKEPLSPERHILWLRLSMVGVAVFAFLFGIFFRQTEYIFLWWAVTMAIYVGGAGAVIIGGLYWKKGTTAGAWTALLVGSTLSVAGILARQVWGGAFPINVQQASFFATLLALVSYVAVSLLTCREDFNMDRLLHRGAYAVNDPALKPIAPMPSAWSRMVGVTSDFSRSDKWIAGSYLGWSLLWFVVFLTGCAWNLLAPWPEEVWSAYWHVVGVGVPVFMALVMAVWFTWGGVRDMGRLFRKLSAERVDPSDDGSVSGGH
ncbi:MAG: sodium:proline symporter [Verrucomicrobia bacterium]|nr:sodium:proline symporter [Verrucomicrobiota bacterium]